MNELIADYADGYLQLMEAIQGVDEELLNYKPNEKAWSIKEIAIHVCDAEIVGVHRMKQVISEDNPLMTAFNQDLWTSRQDYTRLELELHMELFGLLRESMLNVLGNLKDEDWSRTGTHSEAGTLTLRKLVEHFTEHVQVHIRQIARNKVSFLEKASLH